MKRLKSIFTVLLIFGSGLIVGGVIVGTATIRDFVNRTFRDGPMKIRTVLVERARHDLRLDEDQAHQFWQILTETGIDLKQATDPVRPEIEAALAHSEARLRAILRPDQRAPFEKFMEAARTRWQAVLAAAPVKEDMKSLEKPAPSAPSAPPTSLAPLANPVEGRSDAPPSAEK